MDDISTGVISIPAMRTFSRSSTADVDVTRIVSVVQLMQMAIGALDFVSAAYGWVSEQ